MVSRPLLKGIQTALHRPWNGERGSCTHKRPPKLLVPTSGIRPRGAAMHHCQSKSSAYDNTIVSRRRFWRRRSRSTSRGTSGRSSSWKRRRKTRKIIPSVNGGRFNRITSPRSAATMGADKALCPSPKISVSSSDYLISLVYLPYRFVHALRVHDAKQKRKASRE
jgi:hypothetical protein